MCTWDIISWLHPAAAPDWDQLRACPAQVCMKFSVPNPSTQHPAREVCQSLFFWRLHARHVAPPGRSAVAHPRRRSSDRKVKRSRAPPAVATSTEYPTHRDLFASRHIVLRSPAGPKRHIWLPSLVLLPGGSVRPLGALSSEADRDLNVRVPPSSALELPVIVVSQSGGRPFRDSWSLHEGHKRRLNNLPWLPSPQLPPPKL